MKTKLTPDHLRYVDLQEYYEDLQVSINCCAESWAEDLEALEETRDELEAANEEIETLTEQNAKLEKRIKALTKDGTFTMHVARKVLKYPCRNCDESIVPGDAYIQIAEYSPHNQRWDYRRWHTCCRRRHV